MAVVCERECWALNSGMKPDFDVGCHSTMTPSEMEDLLLQGIKGTFLFLVICY